MKLRNNFMLGVTFLAITLSGCKGKINKPEYEPYNHSAYSANVDSEGYTLIDIYGLNDFHGALERDEESKYPGIARLNNFLLNKRSENKGGSIFIASGDMWQGSADSNLSRGKIVNETMNYMGFEAMALGNHEFDWSIDEIIANKAEANFPYLGSNIIYKDSGETVDFVDESPLIERDGVKIGVVGTMGSTLEDTIQSSLIADIEFDVTTSYVVEEAAALRDRGADIVILATHDTWTANNLRTEHLDLIDDRVIDAVFSGHQHVYDKQLRDDLIPVLQTNAYGRGVMHVQFGFNKDTKKLIVKTHDVIENIYDMNLAEDEVTKQLLDYYRQEFEIDKLKDEVVGRLVNADLDRRGIARLAVHVMHDAYKDEDVVAALHNINGGVRVEQMNKGKITYGQIYQAFPFDNEIYIVSILGRQLLGLMTNPSNYATHFSIEQKDVVGLDYYKVATISFIQELDGSPVYGAEFENKFVYTRDLIAQHFRDNKKIDGNLYK